MVEGVCRFFGESEVEKQVQSELTLAVDSDLYFVDMAESFSKEMIQAFRTALSAHIAEVQTTESVNWPNPELYKGHLNLLIKLKRLIAE